MNDATLFDADVRAALESNLTVAALVLAERRRQIAMGYGPEHDDAHDQGQLRMCAKTILHLLEAPPLEMETLAAYQQRVQKRVEYGPGNWIFIRAATVVHKYDELQATVVAQALLMADTERQLRAARSSRDE